MPVTQLDVAKRANVSRALVSLVFRNSPHVSPESRAVVLEAAEELGYRPNALAASLASKEIRTFGVLINDVTNPYLSSVYEKIADAAERAGYALLVGPGTNSQKRELALANTLLGHQVAGLVLLSPFMRDARLRELASAAPSVIIGRQANIPHLDVVSLDEVHAARLIVEHLTALGHTAIAHITGGRSRAGIDRVRGFRTAMFEAGLEPQLIPGGFTEQSGRDAASGLLAVSRLPTALVAANDLVAVGAMGILRRAGIRVPDDVSVVGYDDSQIAQLELVQLTSVRQPIEQYGVAAVDLLRERSSNRMRHADRRLLSGTLVTRQTTGPG